MSHELRTPLNAVIIYSQLLQVEAVDEGVEKFIPDLEKIRGAGKHLLALELLAQIGTMLQARGA